MHCEEKERLLDVYLDALGAFYDARAFSPIRWLRRQTAVNAQESTAASLLDARCDYWWHLEQCGCRIGPQSTDRSTRTDFAFHLSSAG